MAETLMLVEEVSWSGNLRAIVEMRNDVVYFYLWGGDNSTFGLRSVWVRNCRPAPEEIDMAAVAEGDAPALPAKHCAHPEGAAPLDAHNLRIVWFPEQDAAALFDGGTLLAVIPPWSGTNGFNGYALDCISPNPLSWPLPAGPDAPLLERIASARKFWESWSAAPWPAIQTALRAPIEAALGPANNFYAIHDGKWPPMAIGRYAFRGATVFTTLGMSIRPQPRVELQVEDPAPVRRIELAFAIDGQLAAFGNEAPRSLSALAHLPWAQYSWLGDGHTVARMPPPCASSRAAFDCVLLQASPPGAPAIKLPSYQGDPVTLLYVIPITEAERKLAQSAKTAALLEKLGDQGVAWIHRDRDSTV